jgi:hypothetical protein
MQAADEIRKKLATLIGQIIFRCIGDARMIPTVLNRDEVVNLLIDDPAMFQKLVQDEHASKSELSKEDLTINIDAVAELGKLDKLKALEESFWDGPEVDLTPIMDLTNQLTRTFAVFVGNAATLFDKAFEEFMDKFRQSLQKAGMSLKTFDFTLDDVVILEENAKSQLISGDFLQAFTFERLLRSQIMMKQLVNLPATGYSLRENLIRSSLDNPQLFAELTRFVIRVSYISQGSWDDLFAGLARIVYRMPDESRQEQLIHFIEQDVFFSCNLLCSSYVEIRQLTAAQRRLAIERGLQKYRDQPQIT